MAKLTDFGLALDREREGRTRITASLEELGTPFCLSPEQACGEKDIDIRSDIRSDIYLVIKAERAPRTAAFALDSVRLWSQR
jgi:hypothetical protein